MFLYKKITYPATTLLLCCLFILFVAFAHRGNNEAGPKPFKWVNFKNIEQVEYCLSLPLGDYKEKFTERDDRAKHVFRHKTKKNNEIMVQGMLRFDGYSTEEYFTQYYYTAEENGKIIEARELDKDHDRFYARGYYSNDYYKSRFIEVSWMRDGELVRLNTMFNVADSSIWYKSINQLFHQTSKCSAK